MLAVEYIWMCLYGYKMCLQNEIPKKQRNLGSVNISYSVNRELGGNQIQY